MILWLNQLSLQEQSVVANPLHRRLLLGTNVQVGESICPYLVSVIANTGSTEIKEQYEKKQSIFDFLRAYSHFVYSL